MTEERGELTAVEEIRLEKSKRVSCRSWERKKDEEGVLTLDESEGKGVAFQP